MRHYRLYEEYSQRLRYIIKNNLIPDMYVLLDQARKKFPEDYEPEMTRLMDDGLEYSVRYSATTINRILEYAKEHSYIDLDLSPAMAAAIAWTKDTSIAKYLESLRYQGDFNIDLVDYDLVAKRVAYGSSKYQCRKSEMVN